MASPTKQTWTKRGNRDAKLLKNRQQRLKQKQRKQQEVLRELQK